MEIKHPPENGNCSCKECYKSMSKLDELVKNWLSQGKAREWTEVVELIEKLQEQARLDEREAMKKVEFIIRQKLVASIASEKTQEALKIVADLLNELNKN